MPRSTCLLDQSAVQRTWSDLLECLLLPTAESDPAVTALLLPYTHDLPTARQLITDLASQARARGLEMAPPPSDLPHETRTLARC